MRLAVALALAGLWALPAGALQAVAPVVYRCAVEAGRARTTPPSPLSFTQFTLHWRPAAQDAPATLKILHEYFSNAPLMREPPAESTVAGSYAGQDRKGRARAVTVTAESPDDSAIGITAVEPFDLAGDSARFDVTARCTRQ